MTSRLYLGLLMGILAANTAWAGSSQSPRAQLANPQSGLQRSLRLPNGLRQSVAFGSRLRRCT